MVAVRLTGAASSALALVLAASLGGAPQLLAIADEPEHRCGCPVGAHACACPRCAAAARARAAAARHAHAAPASKGPCCHGPAAAPAPRPDPAPEPEHPRSPPDGPCLSPACGGHGAVATLASGADPFVLPQHPRGALAGRAEGFHLVPRLLGTTPASPEPPPPRA